MREREYRAVDYDVRRTSFFPIFYIQAFNGCKMLRIFYVDYKTFREFVHVRNIEIYTDSRCIYLFLAVLYVYDFK